MLKSCLKSATRFFLNAIYTPKYVIICFLLLIACYFLLLTFHSSVFAQQSNLLNAINQQGVNSGTFDDKYFNLNQMTGIMDNATLFLTGDSTLHPEMKVALERNGGGGAVAESGKLLGFFATPPISGVKYFASVFKDAGLITNAQAQSFGFDVGLAPVQQVWAFFRNLAYAGFVIIFVVIGFMIMLRAKIDPQTVASVQTALPRIVIALILVTFSYALAGLMVDLLFVFTSLAVNVLNSSGTNTAANVSTTNAFESIFVLWSKTGDNLTKFVIETTKNINSVIGSIAGVFDWGLGWIIKIVLGVVFLFIAFRIFFMLIMAYVQIIILTIFGPIQFLFSAMPGQSPIGWFKSMLANIMVFPTVVIMLSFADFLNGSFNNGRFFEAPLVGGYGAQSLAGLITFGIILMTPNVANMVKAAIEQKAIPFGVDFSSVASAGAVIGAVPSYLMARKRRNDEMAARRGGA